LPSGSRSVSHPASELVLDRVVRLCWELRQYSSSEMVVPIIQPVQLSSSRTGNENTVVIASQAARGRLTLPWQSRRRPPIPRSRPSPRYRNAGESQGCGRFRCPGTRFTRSVNRAPILRMSIVEDTPLLVIKYGLPVTMVPLHCLRATVTRMLTEGGTARWPKSLSW
jgi:hypothetical protein